VEDNPDDVTIIKRALRRADVRVELSYAHDGEEALNRLYGVGEFESIPLPDLVLLDIILPKIDGLEVLAKIKEAPRLRRIPVIILTISDRKKDMAKAYDSGAAGYITKPIESKDFERFVQTILEYWRMADLPSRPE
jgi:CheY-like chemotaxis protein